MPVYAKIDMSSSPAVIIDVQIAESDDILDPSFSWTDITSYNPPPQIGWTTTDEINFINPAPSMTLSQAIQFNLLEFQGAVQEFVDSRYSIDVRFNFIALYTSAKASGLTNRLAYITQLFTFANAVIAYSASYCSSVKAMTDIPTILSTVPDFTLVSVSDPLVTAFGALEITN